jgi:hypothetical protein
VLYRLTQQPAVHVFPPQHAPPSAPQTVQSEFLQTVPASLHVLLAQQGPPAAPQVLHMLVLLSQTAPASLHAVVLVVELVQQGWLMPPQT